MSTLQNGDDDSFIILGTSPGTSLDMKCNGNGEHVSLDREQMEEAMKDLSMEANMAFKAHFKLGDCPSPASMMVASTIITEDKSTEELQKQFGELLDENVILKETLKQNNESMKEQFLLIASCQEDMMRTHEVHKEKFDQTRDLVEKLRQENKKLKLDLARLTDGELRSNERVSSETGEKSGPSSALEFVTAPDDDTLDKLSRQLDLVEKQRRQVIVDNEKLTWQKESLEHIVDATSKERDDLREKLKKVELQLSAKDGEYSAQINSLQYTIQDLNAQLEAASCVTSSSSEEVQRREQVIQQLEGRVSVLQAELKTAQMRIFELENVKLEFTKHKSGVCEAVKIYKEQIQDLHNRLKEASTTVFQPLRVSLGQESHSTDMSSFTSNVKLYDRTLKHLAELLNALTHGMSDSLVETLGLLASLHDYKLERVTAEQFKSSLAEVKQQIEKQRSTAVNNIGQVRSTLSIFEGIFKDYNEVLKNTNTKPKLERSSNVEALTAALVARGQELTQLQSELSSFKNQKDNNDLLKAQCDLYKSDFEAERESREKMAAEKENIMTDLRTAQRKNQELTQQLEEVRKIDPAIHRRVTSRTATPTSSAGRPRAPATSATTGNMVYTCPKCMRFSCDQYKVMEDHFDFCLDDF